MAFWNTKSGRNRKYATRTRHETSESKQNSGLSGLRSSFFKLLSIAGICGVIAGAVWLSSEMANYVRDQKIAVVRIEGSLAYISESEIQNSLRPFTSESMVTVDLDKIRQTLLEYAWIHQVNIRREWPETIVVDIEEQRAIARWNDRALVNQQGQIFTPEDGGEQLHLPLLLGPLDAEFVVMEQYQKFSQLLYPFGLKLTSLTMNERHAWQFELDNGVQITIGKNQVMEKMRRFTGFLEDGFLARLDEVQSIDLRYNNGLAVLPIDKETEEMVSSL